MIMFIWAALLGIIHHDGKLTVEHNNLRRSIKRNCTLGYRKPLLSLNAKEVVGVDVKDHSLLKMIQSIASD